MKIRKIVSLVFSFLALITSVVGGRFDFPGKEDGNYDYHTFINYKLIKNFKCFKKSIMFLHFNYDMPLQR